MRAELGARAERDAIDERTGRELVLRLHERLLRRELQGADLARATELRHGSRRCTRRSPSSCPDAVPSRTDGVHDMGGMHGFGAVVTPGSDAVSHADWELRVFAISTLVGIERLGKGSGRAIREEMEPAEYLRAGYYERWLWSTEQRLLEAARSPRTRSTPGSPARDGVRRHGGTRRGRARGRRDTQVRSARTRGRRAVRGRGFGPRAADAPRRAHALPALRSWRHRRRRGGSRSRRAPGHRPVRGSRGAGLRRGVRLRRLFGPSSEVRWTVILDLFESYLDRRE